MARKLFAVVFMLALFCIAPVPVLDHASALSSAPQVAAPLFTTPAPSFGASCTQHVCNICANSGLACDPIPYCHCD
ncbi:MAG TPA: hypothetical protein VOA87_03555 [Thermoanaerobaculia bacterium]|nr:hypothetical protein [Thermoanaerobaculia bacterium]